MNKTLISVAIAIWGIMLILSFILQASLNSLNLSCEQIMSTLFPLTIIEIIAFVIAIVGVIKN